MEILAVFLACLPVILIFGLLVVTHKAADISGLIGWGCTVIVAWLYFQTPLSILIKISTAGVLASLPITLMVAASILQITFLLEIGAIKRIVVLMKTISPHNQIVQIMIINIGFGTMLAALGATPVSILPPIMLALGYSSFIAIALPAIGYDSLTTYALLGIPVVVFANFVGQPVEAVGGLFARYMPVVTTCIGMGMLWIVGGWKMIWKGLVPTLLAGATAGLIAIAMNAIGLITITGIAAGLGVIFVMMLYLKCTGQILVDRSHLSTADQITEKEFPLWKATSPWIVLTFFALLVNAPFLPFFELTFSKWALPLEIIPGAAEKLRIFWQAYFWILVSTLAVLPLLKPSTSQLKTTAKKWLKRAPRPMLASAVFFAIAFIYNHSGKNLQWELVQPSLNMVQVLAGAAAAGFGNFYPLIAPFMGLFGGFISGSETSAIAMLTALHLSTAQKIGAAGLLIAAASGIGGGLASVISPAKLQNAAASIDKIGEETKVIPVAAIISLIITLIVALMTLYWAFQ
jgi:lactate permease